MSDDARKQLAVAFAAGAVIALLIIVSYPAVLGLKPATVIAKTLAR